MRLIDRFVYGLWHPGDRWGLLGSCLFLFFSIKHLKMFNLWKHFSYKVISTDVPYNRNIYIQTSNLVYSVKSCSTLICICFLSKFKYLDTSFAIPVLWLHLQNYVKFCQNGWFFLKIVVYTFQASQKFSQLLNQPSVDLSCDQCLLNDFPWIMHWSHLRPFGLIGRLNIIAITTISLIFSLLFVLC